MHKKILEIAAHPSDRVDELVRISKLDNPSFFDGADFNGVDLRKTDISGYDLENVAIEGMVVDDKTIVSCDFFRLLAAAQWDLTRVVLKASKRVLKDYPKKKRRRTVKDAIIALNEVEGKSSERLGRQYLDPLKASGVVLNSKSMENYFKNYPVKIERLNKRKIPNEDSVFYENDFRISCKDVDVRRKINTHFSLYYSPFEWSRILKTRISLDFDEVLRLWS